MGKADKSQKKEFIHNVSTRLVKDPQSFLRLAIYNDIKKWMRRVDGCTHKYVDNGQSFLHIMTDALRQASNGSLTSKFATLQAEHRAGKAVKVSPAKAAKNSSQVIPVPVSKAATTKVVPDTNTKSEKKSSWLDQKTRELPPGFRLDVYYGKTDNETGYKEYTCVVVQTNQQELQCDRQEGLYFPSPGFESKYKILYEVPMNRLKQVCGDLKLNSGFVSPQLKERILQYACEQYGSSTSHFPA